MAVSDPDGVPETLCDGPFYIHSSGQLVTLTFTHQRPDAASMFDANKIGSDAVVRSRIVLTVPNAVALRDLLNGVIKGPETPVAAARSDTKH